MEDNFRVIWSSQTFTISKSPPPVPMPRHLRPAMSFSFGLQNFWGFFLARQKQWRKGSGESLPLIMPRHVLKPQKYQLKSDHYTYKQRRKKRKREREKKFFGGKCGFCAGGEKEGRKREKGIKLAEGERREKRREGLLIPSCLPGK